MSPTFVNSPTISTPPFSLGLRYGSATSILQHATVSLVACLYRLPELKYATSRVPDHGRILVYLITHARHHGTGTASMLFKAYVT